MLWLRGAGSVCALALILAPLGCGGGDHGGSGGAGATDAGGAGAAGASGDAAADAPPICGNGKLEGNEQCDNGPSNAPGSGCELDCTPSCTTNADCDDAESCNGSELCAAAGSGFACKPGAPPAEGSSCGDGGYCKSGACVTPVCGNDQLEPGEGCDPPNGSDCSDDCQVMKCGDGAIVGSEQCDDGNTNNLDGCSSQCRYETIMRFTSFSVRTEGAPSFCTYTKNALGGGLAVEVAAELSKTSGAAIAGGASNLMMSLGGLEDLTGQNAAALDFAMISGKLDPDYASQWTPNAIDGWFNADWDMIDPATQKPVQFLSPASITSRVLLAGPSRVRLRVVSGTTTSVFETLETKIRALVNDTPAPDVPAPPPSALRAGLTVFRSLDATGNDQGLCGAANLASLNNVVLPQDFALGAYACSPNCSNSRSYAYCGPGQPVGPSCNSLLDILVGGCKVSYPLCIEAVVPTQPDVGTNGSPPALLELDSNNKSIVTAPDDGYSFYIRFDANRAHLTDNLP